MNDQKEYTNFNNYQQASAPDPQPAANPQPAAPVDYSQPPVQQSPYAQPVKDSSKTLGILSIVFSSISLFCCGVIFGLVGIILGIIAATKNKKSPLGWIGLGIGIVSVILTIVTLITRGPQIAQYTEQLLNNLK